MSAKSIRHPLLRGLGWGILASLLSSVIFSLIGPPLSIVVSHFTSPLAPPFRGDGELPLNIMGALALSPFVFLFAFLISLLPAALGGVALAIFITELCPAVISSPKVAGYLVGATAGAASILLGIFLFPDLVQDLQFVETACLAVLAWIIAAVAGGLAGQQLASTAAQ